jgi:small subunit ribosomal protein S8
MNTTDPIADFLARINNAIRAKHKKVDIPASNMKRALSKVLAEQNFINGYTEIQDNPQGTIRIALKYVGGSNSIQGLKRVSRPGRRVYVPTSEIPRVLNGLGMAIISTSKGILTDAQAKEAKVGGEVLCFVW